MIRIVQTGRGLAAASVASFHLSLLLALPRYGGVAAMQGLTKFGSRGVDFFFVLSGFVILFAHFNELGKREAIYNYALKRAIRLYPIYWLYAGILIGVFLLFGGTDIHMPRSGAEWISTLTLIRLTAFSPPIPQAWTLFHEVAFYVLFSVLFLNVRAGIALFSGFLVICLVFYHFQRIDDQTPFNVYTSAYNLYFAMGMISYLIFRRPGRGIIETAAGAVLVVAAFALFRAEMRGYHPIFLGFGFALLVAGLAKLERVGWLAPPAILSALGDSSYTLYLIHTNVEGVYLKVLNKIPENMNPGPSARFFIVLGLTLATGYAVYFFVERNLLKLIRHRLIPRSVRRPAPAGGSQLDPSSP